MKIEMRLLAFSVLMLVLIVATCQQQALASGAIQNVGASACSLDAAGVVPM
jgi:hypothetical protein